MKRASIVLILVSAFCGIAVSAYLAQHETSGAPLICNIQNLSGCNVVVASPYSSIFGVPLADFGLLFYTMLFVLAAFELALVDQLLRRVLQVFAVVGIMASLYSIYIQAIIIQQLCIYCMTSALLTLLILLSASTIEPLRRRARVFATIV
jgi:uncharacterized membrane protein